MPVLPPFLPCQRALFASFTQSYYTAGGLKLPSHNSRSFDADRVACPTTSSDLSSNNFWRAGPDPLSFGVCGVRKESVRVDGSPHSACRTAHCRRVCPRQSLAGGESLRKIADAKKRLSAPARRVIARDSPVRKPYQLGARLQRKMNWRTR